MTDTVAAFDFDGTLTTKDSFFRFIAFEYPKVQLLTNLAVTAPLLLLYALRLVGNERHKMALFAQRFEGIPATSFQDCARKFSRICLPQLIRSDALARVRYHQKSGHRVVVVTASLPDWITPWAKSVGIDDVLASQPEIRNGKLTGLLAGKNCYGPEKLRRVLERFPDRESYQLYAYGDTRGDRELLAAADQAFYRRFE